MSSVPGERNNITLKWKCSEDSLVNVLWKATDAENPDCRHSARIRTRSRINNATVDFSHFECRSINIDVSQTYPKLLTPSISLYISASSSFTFFRIKANIGLIAHVKVRFQLTIQKINVLLKQTWDRDHVSLVFLSFLRQSRIFLCQGLPRTATSFHSQQNQSSPDHHRLQSSAKREKRPSDESQFDSDRADSLWQYYCHVSRQCQAPKLGLQQYRLREPSSRSLRESGIYRNPALTLGQRLHLLEKCHVKSNGTNTQALDLVRF